MYTDNEIIELKIENIAFGGSGVGRHEGKVYFVPGTITGEVVRIKALKEKKNHTTARLLEVLESSDKRIEPHCKYGYRPEGKLNAISKPVTCPGCSYQHMEYREELRVKNIQLRDALERIAEIDPEPICIAPIPSPKQFNYRNKITLHTEFDRGDITLGYFMQNNVTVLDIDECPLAHEEINKLLGELKANPSFKHSLKDEMSVVFRYTEDNGAIYWRNNPKKNASWLKETTDLGSISVPCGGFFQINQGGCNILINKVSEMIKETAPETVIDLYCGTGIFSIAAAQQFKGSLIGVDCDPTTIETAKYNAAQRKLQQCEFFAGDAGKLFKDISKEINGDKTTLIVDPPRTGLGRRVRDLIAQSQIKDIVYISCAPDTLSRDLKSLVYNGYKIKSVQLVDMFPRTSHFETITVLGK